MKAHIYPLRILEKHLDSFGHMNNATYLELFEEARWDLITGNGYGYEEVQKNQKGPVILDIKLQFVKELRLRENIQIHTTIPEYRKRIAKIYQQMLKEDGEVAARAEFTFGFFDLKQRKIIRPLPEWRKGLGLD